jgi:hypothetical protein
MKLRREVLVPLLAIGFSIPSCGQPGLPSGPPARVKWIVDLKKDSGFEDFERATSKNLWKQQQGVTFLGSDKIVVHQVKPRAEVPAADLAGSGTTDFVMVTDIFDARDGHKIKRLVLPADAERDVLTPTHAGEFLVRSGDLLTIYSANFQLLASRQLTFSPKASSQEWQVDVSPSGSRIFAVHQQEWKDSNEKNAEAQSKADIEVLDSDTLKTIQSFSVKHLNEWSAGDDAIITTNPDDDPEDDPGILGIMDFEGKWREIRSYAESLEPDCPYEMRTLAHNLILAHDCDDLVVVSRDGHVVFSRPTEGIDYILSTISSDHYLAEGFAEAGSSGTFVTVYDLRRQLPILWIALEKKVAFYSVSSTGSVAVVEGVKLKMFDPPPTASCNGKNFTPACSPDVASLLFF